MIVSSHINANRKNARDCNSGPEAVPDVSAFYFEEAVEMLSRAGWRVGRVECTAPPREAGERFLCVEGVPPRQYRVLRCVASDGGDGAVLRRAGGVAPYGDGGCGGGGQTEGCVCDLLVVRSPNDGRK